LLSVLAMFEAECSNGDTSDAALVRCIVNNRGIPTGVTPFPVEMRPYVSVTEIANLMKRLPQALALLRDGSHFRHCLFTWVVDNARLFGLPIPPNVETRLRELAVWSESRSVAAHRRGNRVAPAAIAIVSQPFRTALHGSRAAGKCPASPRGVS
jgi:hypothetical protein